jgi:hypothetical protein
VAAPRYLHPRSWQLRAGGQDGLLRMELNVLHQLVLLLRRQRPAVDACVGALRFRSAEASTLWGRPPCLRLQLVVGDERAEVSLDDLERLENRPLCEEFGVILRALTVVAATRILGWQMTDGIPTPAAG